MFVGLSESGAGIFGPRRVVVVEGVRRRQPLNC
jgi:hypothetical protein